MKKDFTAIQAKARAKRKAERMKNTTFRVSFRDLTVRAVNTLDGFYVALEVMKRGLIRVDKVVPYFKKDRKKGA